MRIVTTFAVTILLSTACFAQQKGAPQPEWARQARQLMSEGKLNDTLTVLQKELATTPDNPQLNNLTGILLDLMGKGADARKYFSKVIDAAQTNAAKVSADRAMAMSYAFEGDCKNTGKYEQMAIDIRAAEKDFYQQGEIADEAGRVCIDYGDFDAAEKWYKLGHDSGLKDPEIKPDMKDLWEFRWLHAQARLAARRGKKAGALKFVAEAKALLEKDPEMGKTSGQTQQRYLPYLTGYVALYTGDYKTALADLQESVKLNGTDAFMYCLLGQTYEKLGKKDEAMDCYRNAAKATGHNPPVAFGRPFALKKIG